MTITYIITQAAASASLLKDFLYAAWEGRLHNVQSLLEGGRCKPTDEDEVCTSRDCMCMRVLCCCICVCICICPCVSMSTIVHMHVCASIAPQWVV